MTIPGKTRDWPSPFATCLLLGAVVFLGRYLYVSDFGVYEDDYIFVTPGFLWSWREAWQLVLDDLRWWPQGRPVGFSLTHLLSYACGRFDSLTPGFLVGYAIQWANACLFLSLASRLVPRAPALVAALVLALYPVDGAKQMLQVRVFNELNLTFLLGALLLWVRGRRALAYATATLCLLTYESFFFPFAVAPLLVRSWRAVRARQVAAHAAICVAIPAALAVVRKALGDTRVTQAFGDPRETLARIAVASAIGPWTSLRGLVQRTWDGLWRASGTGAIAGALVALGLAYVLDAMTRPAPGTPAAATPAEPGDADRPSLGPVALAGLLAWIAGYVLAFRDDYYPPIVSVGRLSGFHGAGSVGACLLLAAGLAAALGASRAPRRAWVAGSALLVAGLVSLGVQIQRRDYVESWRQQREVWSAVLATSGEWTRATPVVVDLDAGDAERRSTRGFGQIWIASYGPMAAQQLVELPPDWREHQEGGSWTPTVFGYARMFAREPVPGGVRLGLLSWLGGEEAWPVLRDGEFILLRYDGERLVRTAEPLDTGAGVLTPRPPPASALPPRAPTRLQRVLLGAPRVWPSLARARNYPR